ncbi:MAG TPA: hypothetical protein VEO95_04430 [Chthoniobacteraceae bacterium]|nr:hypothetical protein [Chthoniobacteraceae bacterium]
MTSINFAKVANGDVSITANTSMNFSRGISSHACFFVAAPPDRVAELLASWNPQAHPELDVYEHRFFRGAADAAFESLRLPDKLPPVRQLLKAMKSRDDLQLSRAELTQIPQNPTSETAQQFWVATLRNRWTGFTKSGLKAAALQEPFDAESEFKSLVAEEPKVAKHFAKLLAETPLTLSAAGQPVAHYWDVSNVSNVATLSLGAIYRQELQLADFEYFVGGNYVIALTLSEVVPAEIGGKAGALVWQGNYVSSNQLTGGFGWKRKLAAHAIESDTVKTIRFFQRDAAAR